MNFFLVTFFLNGELKSETVLAANATAAIDMVRRNFTMANIDKATVLR